MAACGRFSAMPEHPAADKRPQLLIVGAGGFGREVLAYIEDDNPLFAVKGFLDARPDMLAGKNPRSVGIVGDPQSWQPAGNEVFMAALGDPQARFDYTAALREKGANFAAVAHPLAHLSKHMHPLGHGCIIGPRVSIGVDVCVGAFSVVQEYTVIGHDARIGQWCQINAHCTIAGAAQIGDFVTIHPNCVVTAGAVIGDGVTVAAGSVVMGKIPAGITVLGNPARRFVF